MQAYQIANLMREYIEVLNAELRSMATDMAYAPNNVNGVPNIPLHANNQIKYPPKGAIPQFRNQPNAAMAVPQPS